MPKTPFELRTEALAQRVVKICSAVPLTPAIVRQKKKRLPKL